MNRKTILVRASIEIVTAANERGLSIDGIVDCANPNIENVPYIGTDSDVLDNPEKYKDARFVVTVDECHTRDAIYKKYKAAGFCFTSLIFGYVSPLAEVGEGCIVMPGARISDRSKIANNCRFNFDALVGHDNYIGQSSIIAPRAVCLGHVTIGERTYIGANSTVCPRVEVAASVLVSAGTTVARDLKKSVQVMGYYPLPKMHLTIPNSRIKPTE